jgi:hypothetical protein
VAKGLDRQFFLRKNSHALGISAIEFARMTYWEIIADKSQETRLELGLCLSD